VRTGLELSAAPRWDAGMNRQQQLGLFDRLGRVVTGWPRLFIAAGVACVVIVIGILAGARPVTAMLVGWDAGLLVFFAAVTELARTADTADIRRNAAKQDVGQFVVLSLSAVAALASVVAIYAEVSQTGDGPIANWRLGLGVLTIVVSWFFVHIMFAFHYAHEYYGPGRDQPGGLVFPGEDPEPDYRDFFYFAMTIGMSTEVSDVAITNRRIRRTALAQGIVAFWFNVAVLALLINIAADAIRG
jgi:uncharacterized membrane protein